MRVANEPRFAELPPARIVPMLADEGIYIASESSFHRVLRAHGQTHHRGRARAPQRMRPPSTHVATAINQVWTWDMTFLCIFRLKCTAPGHVKQRDRAFTRHHNSQGHGAIVGFSYFA